MTYYTRAGVDLTPEVITKEQNKSVQKIITTVCQHYKVDPVLMKHKLRTRHVVDARHMAMYLITERVKGLTLKNIGLLFSRDHTSVVHARDSINDQLTSKIDNYIKSDIKTLMQII